MRGHIVFFSTVDNTNTKVSVHGVDALNLQLLAQIMGHMQPSDSQ